MMYFSLWEALRKQDMFYPLLVNCYIYICVNHSGKFEGHRDYTMESS